MEKLAEYIRENEIRSGAGGGSPPSTELLNSLPSPHWATYEFGKKLLTFDPPIRNLFCIRAFAMYNGIVPAMDVLGEYDYLEFIHTDTFPSKLQTLEEFTVLSNEEIGALEHQRLKWELAEDTVTYDDPTPNSTRKHLRSEAVIEYSRICDRIVNKGSPMNQEYQLLFDSLHDYLKEEIRSMLQKCNVINLLHKLHQYGNHSRILKEILDESLTRVS